MTNSITASNIPSSVTKEKVEEFFAFCGKIESLKVEEKSEKTTSYTINFHSPSAVSTALLLNGAELGGSPVTVTSDSSTQPPAYAEKSAEEVPAVSSDPNADIAQELKPKSAIFAEYLSHGYILGDNLVQKAIEHDKKNGYSDKFKTFLADLDAKYNLQDKQKDLQTKQQEIDNKYHISTQLSKYFDRALKTGVGSRLHSFYTSAVNDSLQIHEEAKRLAELKKQEATGSAPATATPEVANTLDTK